MTRALRFASVGLGGFAVQLATLQALASLAHVPYLVATALAVEAAIVHNFVWHERWTWRDRHARDHRLTRFLRFNGATALASIGANVALMAFLVGRLRLPLAAASALAVVTISALNFLLADRLVFPREAGPESTR